MMEVLELGPDLKKDEYRERVYSLRVELQHAQYQVRNAAVPVVVLLGGDDLLGVAETAQVLNEWMDPRWMQVHAFGKPTDDERRRPPFWRYWNALPADGTVGVLLGGWTVRVIADRLTGESGSKMFKRRLRQIRDVEAMLVAHGSLLLKFWLHLDEAAFEKRVKKVSKRPERAWRIDPKHWYLQENFDRAVKVVKEALEETGRPEAPWRVVESGDARKRNLAVAETILGEIRTRVKRQSESRREPVTEPEKLRSEEKAEGLASVDLTRVLPKDKYDERLERWQGKLHELADRALEEGVSTVLVFEGWDAAGKGGVIRRLCAALHPANYRVIPIAAPTDEEAAHHYLWRFGRRLPPDGRVAIFDRSWYGRVLVERVEGFASEAEWSRAYDEINTFEAMMADHGVVIAKFWLHIDPDEQLRRFQDREKTPFKQYKITEEDWRNRKRWGDYERAVNEMVARTDTEYAPWVLVPANDKRYARVHTIKTVCRLLRKAL